MLLFINCTMLSYKQLSLRHVKKCKKKKTESSRIKRFLVNLHPLFSHSLTQSFILFTQYKHNADNNLVQYRSGFLTNCFSQHMISLCVLSTRAMLKMSTVSSERASDVLVVLLRLSRKGVLSQLIWIKYSSEIVQRKRRKYLYYE